MGDGGGAVGGDAAQVEGGGAAVGAVGAPDLGDDGDVEGPDAGKATRATRYGAATSGSKTSIAGFCTPWGPALPGGTIEGMDIAEDAALVVVDVQKGFEEVDFWGARNNPAADDNIAALIDVWQSTGRPVVSYGTTPSSPGRRCGRGTRATGSRSTWRGDAGRGRGRAAGHEERELGVPRDARPGGPGCGRRGSPRSCWPGSRRTCVSRRRHGWVGTSGTRSSSRSTRRTPSVWRGPSAGGRARRSWRGRRRCRCTGGGFATVVATEDVVAAAK